MTDVDQMSADFLDTIARLGDIERDVIMRIASRLLVGQTQYGKFQAQDTRDMVHEASEELLDAVVYMARESIRLGTTALDETIPFKLSDQVRDIRNVTGEQKTVHVGVALEDSRSLSKSPDLHDHGIACSKCGRIARDHLPMLGFPHKDCGGMWELQSATKPSRQDKVANSYGSALASLHAAHELKLATNHAGYIPPPPKVEHVVGDPSPHFVRRHCIPHVVFSVTEAAVAFRDGAKSVAIDTSHYDQEIADLRRQLARVTQDYNSLAQENGRLANLCNEV